MHGTPADQSVSNTLMFAQGMAIVTIFNNFAKGREFSKKGGDPGLG